MVELQKWLPEINPEWFWTIQVFIVVLVTVFANYFLKRFIARVLLKLNRTRTQWDDIIVKAMSRPLSKTSQLRLIRMHGKPSLQSDELFDTEQWRQSIARLKIFNRYQYPSESGDFFE